MEKVKTCSGGNPCNVASVAVVVIRRRLLIESIVPSGDA